MVAFTARVREAALSQSQIVFGKRGASPVQPVVAPASKPEEPSAAYLELAAAARQTLRERDRSGSDEVRAFAASDDDADMRAFIGRGWRAYRAPWEKMKGAPGLTMSRSWPAAAFTGIWLICRKQYVLGLPLLAVQAAMFQWRMEWSGVFDLLVASFLAQFGKSIVLMRAAAAIRRIRSAVPSPDVAAIRIIGAGGRDWVSALCAAALLMGLVVSSVSGVFSPREASDIDLGALERLFPQR